MPVRDVLWACPLCRTAGGIRPAGRRERCSGCGADFKRGAGACIIARQDGLAVERPTDEWLGVLGRPVTPDPQADGTVLGPERVRVKFTRGQEPLYWKGAVLGWIENYHAKSLGTLTLGTSGLLLVVDGRERSWTPDEIRGVQPASSSIQLVLDGEMLSVKFLDGSVRLWTAALVGVLVEHHRACGRQVLELQPRLRTRSLELEAR